MNVIYAIPGLGTTKELFSELEIRDAKLIVLDWPLLEINETMQTLAVKMSQNIDASKPFYLLGVSFGGMLCAEITLIKKPIKTILVSSSKCRQELPLLMRILKYLPFHKIIAESQHRFIAKHSRVILGFDKSYMDKFHEMIDSIKGLYFKRAINCIANWNSINCQRPDIAHLHGNNDMLIPLKNVKADYCINGGTHAMIVNKAKEISSRIDEIIKANK